MGKVLIGLERKEDSFSASPNANEAFAVQLLSFAGQALPAEIEAALPHTAL